MRGPNRFGRFNFRCSLMLWKICFSDTVGAKRNGSFSVEKSEGNRGAFVLFNRMSFFDISSPFSIVLLSLEMKTIQSMDVGLPIVIMFIV